LVWRHVFHNLWFVESGDYYCFLIKEKPKTL
jgi:hypothetical protein